MPIWAETAHRDLQRIKDFIARDNLRAALQIGLEIIERCELLDDQPLMGRAGRIPGTREWLIHNRPFYVVYRVPRDSVEIVRVIHTSQHEY